MRVGWPRHQLMSGAAGRCWFGVVQAGQVFKSISTKRSQTVFKQAQTSTQGKSHATLGGKYASVLKGTAGTTRSLQRSEQLVLTARVQRQKGPRRLVLCRFDRFRPLTDKAFEAIQPPRSFPLNGNDYYGGP